jgi:hypothetical protein
MHPLKQWLKNVTPKERKRFVKLSKISVPYLYQLIVGSRNASADVASRIENATIKISKGNMSKILLRGQISKTCAKCPYYKENNK